MCTALPDDLSSILSTHVWQLNYCNCSSRRAIKIEKVMFLDHWYICLGRGVGQNPPLAFYFLHRQPFPAPHSSLAFSPLHSQALSKRARKAALRSDPVQSHLTKLFQVQFSLWCLWQELSHNVWLLLCWHETESWMWFILHASPALEGLAGRPLCWRYSTFLNFFFNTLPTSTSTHHWNRMWENTAGHLAGTPKCGCRSMSHHICVTKYHWAPA